MTYVTACTVVRAVIKKRIFNIVAIDSVIVCDLVLSGGLIKINKTII